MGGRAGEKGEKAGENGDERFAISLLMDHLAAGADAGFRAERSAHDPPDLTVTWENGEQWGVEVTRTYQQVDQIGDRKRVSSECALSFLQDFGQKLGKEAKITRPCAYTIYFEGPGPFSSWKRPVSRKKWKKETKSKVLNHIALGESGILRIPGCRLIPSEPGFRWTVIIGHPTAAMGNAIAEMLQKIHPVQSA